MEMEEQIKEKIVIEITESVRSSIYEEVYVSVREEFEVKTRETQLKLHEAEEYIERLVADTERYGIIITGLEAKYEELLQ